MISGKFNFGSLVSTNNSKNNCLVNSSNSSLVISRLLILAIVFFSIFAGVNALSIEGPSSISLCQCDTESHSFNICADVSGTYTVSVSGLGAKWVKLAPKTLNISSGSCKEVFIFVTPECFATSGTFPFELNVAGDLENESKNISLFVEQCHTFDFVVNPTTNSSMPCEKNEFNVSVTNTGKFTDEFVLFQDKLDDSWVSYPRESFVLGSGESLNTKLIVESSCSTPSGSYPFTLRLSNTKTNASEVKELLQKINFFTPIEHNINSNISLCAEEGMEYLVNVTNVSSKEDVITIDLNGEQFVSVDKESLVIGPNETKEFKVIIAPTSPQETSLVISLSSKNYGSVYSTEVNAVINDCYNVSIDRIDTQENYCIGNNSQKFLVSNNGTKDIEATITVTGINSESKKVTIPSNDSEEVSLSFVEQEGTKNIVVTAQTKYSEDKVEYSLNFEDCYGAELTVPSISVCSTETRNVELLLKNTGTMEQEFNISTNASWIEVDEEVVVIAPKSEKTINLLLSVPEEIDSEYLVTIISDNTTLTRIIPIELLSQENCYSFEVTKSSEVIDVNCCDGAITEIIVKNTGAFAQTFDIEKIAPEWVSFSHSELTLYPNEEKIVYVYFAPPIGTNGELLGTIKVTNQKNLSKTFDFNLNVFGGGCGVGLNADLGVDGQVALTKIFTRKEIDVEFNIMNDSNVGFNIVDIKVQEYPDTEVKFERNIFLEPMQSVKARMTISFLENQEPADREVTLDILTSVGEFQKKQLINFSDSNNVPVYNEVAITGFFTQFVAPAVGILVLLLILVIVFVVLSKSNSGNKNNDTKKRK